MRDAVWETYGTTGTHLGRNIMTKADKERAAV
jgi:hypothetical protein